MYIALGMSIGLIILILCILINLTNYVSHLGGSRKFTLLIYASYLPVAIFLLVELLYIPVTLFYVNCFVKAKAVSEEYLWVLIFLGFILLIITTVYNFKRRFLSAGLLFICLFI